MGGVVFEHVDHVVKIDEGIVDGDDVDVISGQGSSADESKFKLIFMLKRNFENLPTNSAKSVDTNVNHFERTTKTLNLGGKLTFLKSFETVD